MIVQLENVYKVFSVHQTFLAVRDVSLTIQHGEFVTFLGPSGCGKSTVINMVAGLVQPSSGRVLYEGREVREPNVGVGYVHQQDNLLPWRTLQENVEIGLEIAGLPRHERAERAGRLICAVGLAGFERLYPHQLSGGMRKRVSIIRTLICDPALILMDEPFGPLDAQTRLVLQAELLRLWEGTGKTIIFVTHDLVESIALSSRIVVFSRAPGTIKHVLDVDIPRPRDVFDIFAAKGFNELFSFLWETLKDELETTRQAAAEARR